MFAKISASNKSEASTETIPAYKYEKISYDGMMDAIHGGGDQITEIFIPSHDVCFNSEGYVYQSEKARNVNTAFNSSTPTISEMTTIQLSKELVDKLVIIANLETQIKKEKKALEAEQDYQQIFPEKFSREWEPGIRR